MSWSKTTTNGGLEAVHMRLVPVVRAEKLDVGRHEVIWVGSLNVDVQGLGLPVCLGGVVGDIEQLRRGRTSFISFERKKDLQPYLARFDSAGGGVHTAEACGLLPGIEDGAGEGNTQGGADSEERCNDGGETHREV